MKHDIEQKTTPQASQRGRFRWPPAYERISDRRIWEISLPLMIMPAEIDEEKIIIFVLYTFLILKLAVKSMRLIYDDFF